MEYPVNKNGICAFKENDMTTKQIIDRINMIKSKENKTEDEYTEIQDLLLEVDECNENLSKYSGFDELKE